MTGVMVKPVGSLCNHGCSYCYYLSTSALYQGGGGIMDDEVLEACVRQAVEACEGDSVSFCWHGGEPLLAGLPFFRKAVRLQRRYAGGKRIDNSLQTNGLLVDDNWCRFFRDNDFLIGISIDGPKDIHDAFRKAHSGVSSFDAVVRAVGLFRRHRVEFNTLSVVSSLSEGRGVEIYRFFRDTLGSRFMQFLPAADRQLPWAVSAKGYGRFLTDIFDEWVSRDVGEYFVQMFDATLAGWYGVTPGVCTVNDACNDSLVVERNGDVYPCDHFVRSGLCLGNIRESTLGELYASPRRVEFSRAKCGSLAAGCRGCKYAFACHGECPEHRVNGHNVLCEGLKDYFSHVTPAMDGMKELLLRRRSPAEIMNTWVMCSNPPH